MTRDLNKLRKTNARLAPWLARPQSMVSVRLTKLSLLLADVLALALSALLAFAVAISFSPHAPASFDTWMAQQSSARYLGWLLVAAVGVTLFLGRYRHYSERKPFWRELGEILNNVFWLALFDMALMSLARWNASRLWWLAVWLLAAALIPLARWAARQALLRFRLWQRPTVLIGAGPNAVEAMLALRSEPSMGFEVVGCVPMRTTERMPDTLGEDLPALLTPARLHRLTSHAGLQVVIAVEHHESAERERWLRQLAKWQVQDVSVIPAMRGIPLFGTDISYFFSHEVALLRVTNNLRHWPARLSKRVFDITASLALLAVLSPLMLYLVLRIRTDGGSAVFAHQRVGRKGETFPCYKFRSMVPNAQEQLDQLLKSDVALRAQWERDHKLKQDPRITPIGHFLRQTSLDELPQLWNVLRGEMSLVGPRPIVPAELARYGDDAEYFLMVRPGITGLWQVSGRNDTGYGTRVFLDIWYIKNWSLWYDIAILFKTVRVVLRREGAY
jgi:Undecaprenyl-phosphate galactose phosphotransferase WbaP